MKSNKLGSLLMCLATCALAASVNAAVTADEAKQLDGATLTAWGAEKAGNKDGSIPAYTEESVSPPAGFDPVKEPLRRPDPWNEKPLFSITAQNADKYASKLGAGMLEMFKKYPDYRMDIYPTHRTANYPKSFLDNTVKNATSCKGTQNELKLEGCYGGLPFPIPKTGNQVMWNHNLSYGNSSYGGRFRVWFIPNSSAPVMQAESDIVESYPTYDAKFTQQAKPSDTFFRVRIDDQAPARKAGGKILLMDAYDTLDAGRRAWQYIPGQRRVKLAPDLSYDTPSPYGGGISTMDDQRAFFGALDRFDFKLMGKDERFLPYNVFKLWDYKTCPDEKVNMTKHFPNPDCVRWELHRVWTVEANLKQGYRHAYKKRIFYWDEDTFGAGIAENYDAAGKLYRLTVAPYVPYWNRKGAISGEQCFFMDFQTGAWVNNSTGAFPGGGYGAIPPRNDFFFSPESMAGEGVR